MALSTYAGIWGRVLLRCPIASPLLARDWVTNAFRQLAEKRAWSWLWKEGQFLLPAIYAAGTVVVNNNSTTVTGTGTAFTAQMIGRQFRIGNGPFYTIATRTSGTVIDLDRVYGGSDATAATFEIAQVYVTVPSDFHSFLTVVDMDNQGYRLHTNIGQDELDFADPERTSTGDPLVLSFHDYDGSTPPIPRYEVWPRPQAQLVLSYLYEIRATDLEDSGANLPRHVRGDLLLEMALANCAKWPGPSKEQPNPYFNLGLADRHDRAADKMIAEMMRQDEEVAMQNVRYQSLSLPLAELGADWHQSHAVYPYG